MDEADDRSLVDLLRESADDFVGREHQCNRLRGWIGKPRPVERRLWGQAAELGWLSIMLKEELGGSGLGLREAAVLCEVFGRHLFAEPFVAGCVLPSVLLNAAAGADGEAGRLAAILAGGERLLTLAWQEAVGEIDPAAAAAAVLADGKLTGRKLFVPAVESDTVLLVRVAEAGAPAVVAVAADAPGVTIDRFAAGVGAQAHVRFEAAPIEGGAPLLRGEAAAQAVAQALAAGRIGLAAELSGMARGGLDVTLAHVRDRWQFERPLGSFQTVQHRCVDLYIGSLLADASWRNALDLYEKAPLSAATQAAVSAAKARAGDAARDVGRVGVQLHGAMGFCEEAAIGLYLRAAVGAGAWLGTAPLHRRRFAGLGETASREAPATFNQELQDA